MEKQVSFQFKARYYKLGTINANTKEMWFVLHGYGQLAQYFIKKFSVLEQKAICVIAPEGLSRFYLENFQAGKARANDRVGATWMTKENRQMDIDNYLTYLNEVYQTEVKEITIPITILGFSQGAATASRWAISHKVNFNRLILWSGIFPTDMNFQTAREALINKKVLVVYGSHDPFVTADHSNQLKLATSQLSLEYEVIKFEGGHEINSETLVSIAGI